MKKTLWTITKNILPTLALFGTIILVDEFSQNCKDVDAKNIRTGYEMGLPFIADKLWDGLVKDSVVDKIHHKVTYELGGGWKAPTIYVTTRNDIVISVKEVYPGH